MTKRLILLVSVFPQLSETFIVSKFLGLLEHGWDVHIVCQRFATEAWLNFTRLKNVPDLKSRVHRVWPHRPRWLAALLLPLSLLYGLLADPRKVLLYFQRGWRRYGWGVLRRFYLDQPLIRLNPDIIHFEFGSLAVGRTHLKDLLDAKLSASFRGFDLNYVGLDSPGFYAEVWESIDAGHFLGEDLWQRAQARGCPADMPHALISPALNLADFPNLENKDQVIKLGTPDHPLRILSVGRLHWKKGVEYGLRAVKVLVDQGIYVEYRIIGEGEHQSALYFARHQMELTGTVEFLGGLSHAEVIEQLQWADVFLHSAVSEGFCNAVLEAQAMKLPVVCSDADGLSENVADGQTGFVVPRRNPDAMAHKLALLAQDGRLRQKMGSAGRKRVETYFTIEKQITAFEAFYDNLLEIESQEKNT